MILIATVLQRPMRLELGWTVSKNAGNPDTKNGHIRIANELWGALIEARLTAREWNLVACIIRKTYGWQKYEDRISLSQFEEMTGIAKNKIWSVTKGLIDRNIIKKTLPQKGHTSIPTYSINKFYKRWKGVVRYTPKGGIPQKGVEGYPKLGIDPTPKRGTTKDTTQKTLLQKKKEGWFENLWIKYPEKDGKKEAKKHFMASVHTEEDHQKIQTALKNYLGCEKVNKGYIKNGSTWFNNWEDWVDYKIPTEVGEKITTGDEWSGFDFPSAPPVPEPESTPAPFPGAPPKPLVPPKPQYETVGGE